ncbi:MAG: cupredoxin domain-containing protein [Gaiellaceae bacterium]
MMRFGPLMFLALALAACGSGGDDGDDGNGAPAGQGAQTIEIVGTEYALEPATVELDELGTYTFVLRNEGGTLHALEFEGHGVEEETEEIGAGETAELTVELTEAGEYELYCPVDDHRHRGMEGTVVVGGGAGGAGTDETTTDETTTEDDGGYDY